MIYYFIYSLFHYPYPFNVAAKDDIKMLIEMMEKRFESLQREMNKRFEAAHQERNAIIRELDKRFEAINKGLNLIT